MTMSYVRFPYEELGAPAKTPIKPVDLRTADEWKVRPHTRDRHNVQHRNHDPRLNRNDPSSSLRRTR